MSDLIKGAERGEPVPVFIEEICTHINPLDVARWLDKQRNLSRKMFGMYIAGASTMWWKKEKKRGKALGLNKHKFFKLVADRIVYVMKLAGEYDTIGELSDFAKYISRNANRKIFLPKGFGGNGA